MLTLIVKTMKAKRLVRQKKTDAQIEEKHNLATRRTASLALYAHLINVNFAKIISFM